MLSEARPRNLRWLQKREKVGCIPVGSASPQSVRAAGDFERSPESWRRVGFAGFELGEPKRLAFAEMREVLIEADHQFLRRQVGNRP
jgi:hypothetical protein